MSVCTECGRSLVEEPPPPPAPPTREYGTARVDIAGLGRDDRALVDMLLRSEEIPVEWSDEVVVVPIDRAAAVTELLQELDDAGRLTGVIGPLGPQPATTAADGLGDAAAGPLIAARWQRLAGWFIDSLLIGVVSRILADRDVPWWLIGIVVGAYWIVGTAVRGRTVGKLAVGTQVTGPTGRPGWRVSLVRWAVAGWIGFAGALSAGTSRAAATAIAVLASATWLVTYAPILWDTEGRGLHDRLAGTVVIRRRASTSPPAG